MELERIPPHQVVAVWPKVERYLAAALEHSAGEYSLDQLRVFLTSGMQTLLAFVKDGEAHGAICVATESFPNMSVAFVTAIGGHCFVTRDTFKTFAAWCKSNGYTHIRGAAHESVARLWHRFEAREIYRMVEIKL